MTRLNVTRLKTMTQDEIARRANLAALMHLDGYTMVTCSARYRIGVATIRKWVQMILADRAGER